MNNMTKSAYYNMLRQQDPNSVLREGEMYRQQDPNSVLREGEMRQMQQIQQTPLDPNSVLRENEMQMLRQQMQLQQMRDNTNASSTDKELLALQLMQGRG